MYEGMHRLRRWVARMAVLGLGTGWGMKSGPMLHAAGGPSDPATWSIARVWNEETLAAIRIDLPHPPAQARNLFSLSVAMYDAWAAFEPGATGYLYRRKHRFADPAEARRVAISHAAYRILRERYAYSVSATTTLERLRTRMRDLRCDPGNTVLDPATPAGLGNIVGATVSAWFLEDGARQQWGYSDTFSPSNGYLDVDESGTQGIWSINEWQPLVFTRTVAFGQGGGFRISSFQQYLGSQWLGVRPFALNRSSESVPWIDPGPPPRYGEDSSEAFLTNVVAVLRASGDLDTSDRVMIDISPGSFGANPLGSNDGKGHPLNPVTGAPYAPNRVPRADFVRVLAEFWADGPKSETPPGHWNVIANQVTAALGEARRIGGTGRPVDPLEWDVKLYFALNAGLHDAACAAWSLKRYYNGWRPISAIRALAESEALPLVPGVTEQVTTESAKPGQRHAGLEPGTILVRGWLPPAQIFGDDGLVDDPHPTQTNGVSWIPALNWMPFQKRSFVTPAFPGYVSGHSTFSRSAAEVLAAFTGSEFFPGGLGTHRFAANSLTIEKGPSQAIELQWGTYFDAADQAGLSRIWGGIHPPVDDLVGRRVGAEVGQRAWALARTYFDGTAPSVTISRFERAGPGRWRIQYPTLRGMRYALETSPGLEAAFTRIPGSEADGDGHPREMVVERPEPTLLFRVMVDPQ